MIVKIMDWLFSPHKNRIAAEREQTRKARGGLASKVIELDNARHQLDEMVRRSLALLEGGKK